MRVWQLAMMPLALLLCCCCVLSGNEPPSKLPAKPPALKPVETPVETPQIILPTIPVLIEPDVIDDTPEPPRPKPKPDRGPVPVAALSEDTWYVIESSVPLIVIHSPAGFVGVQPEEGPVKVRGKFADGTGATETRTFASKHLYFVNAMKAGQIELLIVPTGVTAEKNIIRQTLVVMGLAPIPPPDPTPIPPGPEPTPPEPAPIPGDSNRVLIVYESSELSKLPVSQAVLMTAANVREYLNRKCGKGSTGTPEFRIWDKDTDTSNVGQVWKDAMGLPRNTVPWLIVSNGKAGYSGPLPVNEVDLLAKLKQYLGE